MKNTVKQEMALLDMTRVMANMTKAAKVQLKRVSTKSLEGMTAEDFVMEVILKTLDGRRDWYSANCSFESFLFMSLRSDVSNFIKLISRKSKGICDIYDYMNKTHDDENRQ